MKKYRLLKDLPGFLFNGLPKFVVIPAGTIFEYRDTAHYHNYRAEFGGVSIYLNPCAVEPNSIWFEEVKEEYKGMTATEAIKHINNSVEFKPQGNQPRRKAPAYIRLGGGDWEVSCCMYDSYEAARRDYEIEEVVGWPALPDKDGYYPGPK